MRIAVLYDQNFVRMDQRVEFTVDLEMLNGKDIFDRDPLACKFTFLDEGTAKNDLIVVGVHLASGQYKVANHNRAMSVLLTKLKGAFREGGFSSGEKDVLIAGDFNASRYDDREERFWTNYDNNGFKFRTLAPENREDYPGTRLSGVPLYPRSQIDYIMASGQSGGLLDELVQTIAHVHIELLPANFNDFRRSVSDHLPVTVRIQIVDDTD